MKAKKVSKELWKHPQTWVVINKRWYSMVQYSRKSITSCGTLIFLKCKFDIYIYLHHSNANFIIQRSSKHQSQHLGQGAACLATTEGSPAPDAGFYTSSRFSFSPFQPLFFRGAHSFAEKSQLKLVPSCRSLVNTARGCNTRARSPAVSAEPKGKAVVHPNMNTKNHKKGSKNMQKIVTKCEKCQKSIKIVFSV